MPGPRSKQQCVQDYHAVPEGEKCLPPQSSELQGRQKSPIPRKGQSRGGHAEGHEKSLSSRPSSPGSGPAPAQKPCPLFPSTQITRFSKTHDLRKASLSVHSAEPLLLCSLGCGHPRPYFRCWLAPFQESKFLKAGLRVTHICTFCYGLYLVDFQKMFF